jgi:ATP-binding cassette subfamily B (MDR/TAP) protein 1
VTWAGFDFPEHSTGELTTRLEADAEAVANVTGWALGYRIRIISTMCAGIAIALAFAWQVGLIAIFCVPLIMGAAIIQRICLAKRFVRPSDEISPATLLEQGLRGVNSVQAFGLEDKFCEKYSKALEPESEGNIKMGMVAGLVFGFSQFAIFCSFAVLFYVGSQLLVNEKIDFAEFFTSVLAVLFGALGMAQVTVDFNAQQEGKAAAGRIFDIIDEKLNELDPLSDAGEKPESIQGKVTFKSCHFGYPTRPNHPVYRPTKYGQDGLNLCIAPKESVGFVGMSGSGKSTALQLLLRFYDVQSGSVQLDHNDVKGLNMKWLRGQIGYVGQLPVLFAGTVKDNILLGNAHATDEEIIQAAKAANAHDFIMQLSQQYDTNIGPGGGLLSGGQRQRLGTPDENGCTK